MIAVFTVDRVHPDRRGDRGRRAAPRSPRRRCSRRSSATRRSAALAAQARQDLLDRVDDLLDAEAARYFARIAAVGVDADPGGELRAAAAEVERARVRGGAHRRRAERWPCRSASPGSGAVTKFVGQVREALRGDRRVDPDELLGRLDARPAVPRAVDGHLPADRLVAAHTLVERAGGRLALSRDHTVVALAGATGSGKSSLFNALARLQAVAGRRAPADHRRRARLRLGHRRTTPAGCSTGSACCPATGSSGRARSTATTRPRCAAWCCSTCPTSTRSRRAHRLEVDRLLGLVDLVVWVRRPAEVRRPDRARRLPAPVPPAHATSPSWCSTRPTGCPPPTCRRCSADLRRLLEDDGLGGVPVLATSAVQDAGHGRAAPAAGTHGRRPPGRAAPALRRPRRGLAGLGDAGRPAGAATTSTGRPPRSSPTRWPASAGVPAVAEATEHAYRHRAGAATGWPMVRGLAQAAPRSAAPAAPGHPDVVGTELAPADGDAPRRRTSLPEPTAAQQSAVGLAVRTVADTAAGELPEPWPAGARRRRPVPARRPARRARPGGRQHRSRRRAQAALVAGRRPAAVAAHAGRGGRPGLADGRLRRPRPRPAPVRLSDGRRGAAADVGAARRPRRRHPAVAAAQAVRPLGRPARPAPGRGTDAGVGHRGGPRVRGRAGPGGAARLPRQAREALAAGPIPDSEPVPGPLDQRRVATCRHHRLRTTRS